jgi:hypothetical protein
MSDLPVTSPKFPDPLDKIDQQVTQLNEQKVEEKPVVNKAFWRNVLIVLVFIPLVTGVGIFAYQTYLDITLRQSAEKRETPTIDSSQVVTPVPLPTADLNRNASNSAESSLTTYVNTFGGYKLQHPPEVQLQSKTDQPAAVTQYVQFTLAIEASNPVNMLDIQVFDSEPPQSATQSATRDFGQSEFKVYEYATSTAYVGQLSTGGKWLQLIQQYDANIKNRTFIQEVINTFGASE